MLFLHSGRCLREAWRDVLSRPSTGPNRLQCRECEGASGTRTHAMLSEYSKHGGRETPVRPSLSLHQCCFFFYTVHSTHIVDTQTHTLARWKIDGCVCVRAQCSRCKNPDFKGIGAVKCVNVCG